MKFQTSVIIVSYNNYETTTKLCLQSLLKEPGSRDFEIIVVDNASRDDTPRKLLEIASQESGINVVLNEKNRGFAGGNNAGANIAQGEILFLLNSDTIASPFTISKLSRLMIDNPDWGMLGPATNAAGNEQKIFIESGDTDKIIEEGEVFCSHSNGDYFPSERLDFFCVAIRKTVYEQIGGLDELFGRGYYEDVDFSMMAKRAGIKMMFAEDCFVYHGSGKSFSGIGRKNVKKLMHENKRKLGKKYSEKVKLYHMRDRNINIMNEYVLLRKQGDSSRLQDLDYKFNNRLLLANSIYPHNPIKKMFYYLRIRRLCSGYDRAKKTVFHL